MEVTFWGVRGSIPAPGPATVRYGGNTSCLSVRLASGGLVIVDCGTGARNLGIALAAAEFGRGEGRATILLSHPHWDHIQGFPFFAPFYVPGNSFVIYGGAGSPQPLQEILERQMSAQFFPVQSIGNLNATLTIRTLDPATPVDLDGARLHAHPNPHGATPALAFRIEDAGKVLVYASDAGYGAEGPSPAALALYAGADLLIHDATFTPEDRAGRAERGLSSLDDAVDAALRARVKRLALFHYDQDYTDHDVDQMVARGRRRLAEAGLAAPEILGAQEGATLTV